MSDPGSSVPSGRSLLLPLKYGGRDRVASAALARHAPVVPGDPLDLTLGGTGLPESSGRGAKLPRSPRGRRRGY